MTHMANCGKLAIRTGHPRSRIKIKLCMVGGLRCVIAVCNFRKHITDIGPILSNWCLPIHVKCDPNRLRGYGCGG